MAQSTIFGAQTPGGSFNDSVAYTMGTRFTPGVAGWATHGRWAFPATLPTGTVSCGVYRNGDQLLLGSATFTAPVAGAWNTAAFSSPIALEAGVAYTAVIWTPNRYVATTGFPWPTGSGDLVSDATTAGRFTASAGPFTFPNSGSGAAYFADIVFETALSTNSAPSGIAVPVATGAPTTTLNRSAAVSGISVPAPPGQPATALGLAVAASGLAVPVPLGAPATALTQLAAPAGIAAAVACGAPIVGRNGASSGGLAAPAAAGMPTVMVTGIVSPSGVSVPVLLGALSAGVAGPTYIERPDSGWIDRPDTGWIERP